MRRAFFLVMVLAVLAGCGGNGGKALTRQEYASKADAICTKYNEQVKTLQNPANLSELGDVADRTIPILDNAIHDLRKLKPPKDESKVAEQWLSQVDGLKDDLTKIRDKAKDNDMQGVQSLVPSAQNHNARSNELATELGMTVCNSG
jgi:hypothetical protein